MKKKRGSSRWIEKNETKWIQNEKKNHIRRFVWELVNNSMFEPFFFNFLFARKKQFLRIDFLYISVISDSTYASASIYVSSTELFLTIHHQSKCLFFALNRIYKRMHSKSDVLTYWTFFILFLFFFFLQLFFAIISFHIYIFLFFNIFFFHFRLHNFKYCCVFVSLSFWKLNEATFVIAK